MWWPLFQDEQQMNNEENELIYTLQNNLYIAK